MDNSNTPLEQAIAVYHAQCDLDSSLRRSIRDIATEFEISHVTLSKHVSGRRQTRQAPHAHQQALTNEEELAIISYIRRMSLSGHPPPTHVIRETAQELLRNRLRLSLSAPPESVSEVSLGVNWVDKLRSRHPSIAAVWTRIIDKSRIDECAYKACQQA